MCNAGAGAFVDGTGALRCEILTGEMRRYGPGGGPESAPVVAKAEQGLAPAALHLPAGTPWLGALLAGRWLTRRRRGGRAAGPRSGGSEAAR